MRACIGIATLDDMPRGTEESIGRTLLTSKFDKIPTMKLENLKNRRRDSTNTSSLLLNSRIKFETSFSFSSLDEDQFEARKSEKAWILERSFRFHWRQLSPRGNSRGREETQSLACKEGKGRNVKTRSSLGDLEAINCRLWRRPLPMRTSS